MNLALCSYHCNLDIALVRSDAFSLSIIFQIWMFTPFHYVCLFFRQSFKFKVSQIFTHTQNLVIIYYKLCTILFRLSFLVDISKFHGTQTFLINFDSCYYFCNFNPAYSLNKNTRISFNFSFHKIFRSEC